MPEPVTLVNNPIHNPQEPRHFMVIKALDHPATASIADIEIATSLKALRIQEVGWDLYDPVVYFRRSDVKAVLEKSGKTTECPLKGVAEYFNVAAGEMVLENAAWSYLKTYDFDERLSQIQGRIAFDTSLVQVTELTV